MPKQIFRLNGRALLLGGIAAAYPVIGYTAPAAQVDFATGNVKAISPNGQSRTIVKGAQIEQGEMISTNNGRAQLRFTDGAYVSLQPESEFRIDQYRFDGKQDGNEKGFFSLLKGGLRTITGLVGRSNKNNYQVTTSVATIGIRGTEYTIQYGRSVTGTVGEGEINVCNGAGCLSVTNGESYYVQAQEITPVLTNKRTDLPPPSPQNPPPSFAEGEKVNEDGDPCVLFPSDCVAPDSRLNGTFNAHITSAHTQYAGTGSHVGAGSAYSGSAAFDTGKLVSMKDTGGGTVGPGTTVLSDAGSDEFIAWGRLSNGVLGGTVLSPGNDHAGASFSGNESFHYVVGLPTASLPVLGSVTYSLLGATAPTFTTGSGLVGLGVLESMTLLANLSTGASGTFNMSLKDPEPSASAIALSGTFSGGLFFSGSGTGSGACSGTCSVTINGFFAGANAERAGISYDVQGAFGSCGGFSCKVVGVAALKR